MIDRCWQWLFVPDADEGRAESVLGRVQQPGVVGGDAVDHQGDAQGLGGVVD